MRWVIGSDRYPSVATLKTFDFRITYKIVTKPVDTPIFTSFLTNFHLKFALSCVQNLETRSLSSSVGFVPLMIRFIAFFFLLVFFRSDIFQDCSESWLLQVARFFLFIFFD